MEVREIENEFARYLVQSASSPHYDYMVDLTARGGMGECTCTHYLTTCKPNYEKTGKRVPYTLKGENVVENVTECKHIEAAHRHFFENVTMPMLANFEQ